MGSTCEFCARYVGGAPQQAPQAWQPPQQQYAPAQAYAGGDGGVHTGISFLELQWARTRVMWAWILFGAIGGLTLAAYWLIKTHPDVLGQLAISLLLDPNKVNERTTLDILQLIAYFILSWLPLAGLGAQFLLSHPQNGLAALTQALALKPLLYQGVLYVVLAVLIWRRSTIALAVATLLFLADSGIYTYGVFRLFQGLWDLNQKFVEMTQGAPSLAANNPYALGHWPWGLALPIVARAALLWMLVGSFSGMTLVTLDHKRRKAARREAEAQSEAA